MQIVNLFEELVNIGKRLDGGGIVTQYVESSPH